MKRKALVLFSFIMILSFPQYAFSITPADNSTSTSSGPVVASPTSTTSTPTSDTTPITDQPVSASTAQASSTSSAQSNSTVNGPSSSSTTSTTSLSSTSSSTTNTSYTYNGTSTNAISNIKVNNSLTSSINNTGESQSSTQNVSLISMQSSRDTTTNSSSSASTSTTSNNTTSTSNANASSTSNALALSASTIPPSTSNSTLTVSTIHSTTVTVTPNPSTVPFEGSVTFSATVTDNSSSPTIPSGTMSWSDGNVGGTFNPASCTLSSGSCTTSYTPRTNSPNSVTITASYGGDSTHSTSTGTSSLTVNPQHTTITITPNPATVNQGSWVKFTVNVAGNSSSSIPTGTISWTDGNAGGIFNPAYCTLSSGSCITSYTPPLGKSGSVIITASYGGDETHSVGTATDTLTVNSLHGTTITITPNPATVIQGSPVPLTVSVSDNSSSPTTPSGTMSWSDGNVGGTFNPASCTLSSGSCTTSYTPAESSSSSVTVTAYYGGDSDHYGSSGTSQISITVLPASLSLTTDQSYYAYGDVVTISVNLPSQSLQNIAVGVSDPNGNNIIARTVTTDENGTGTLQFKIPSTYQTGTYQDFATAVVDGKSYTNSTDFMVIKSRGLTIDSVQITNQQGDPVSMLKKGQNGFVRVSISSGEKMPALLTLNLFDANQSSLGTASIQSIVNPGQSNMTLSFFIPSNAQSGLSNVYTDTYSDWPANGGTPLTTESCLVTDLQDPSTLPISYVPNPPHSCTSPPNGNGIISGITNTQNIAMTNDKAMVTLGVAIQNDSMTFMSPAEAHLLALAYDNGTATNTQNDSVALISLNLNNMTAANPSSIQTSGGVTTMGHAQFTTIAGPDIQNNPMALKILQEIQASKRQVANILGNETAAKLNQQLILQQRQAAANQLKQDLTTLAQANAATTPDAAYASFLTTVGDNRTQAVFQNEYNFMQQRVGAANAAMQTALDNGASLDQALSTFDQYATINHVQMVALNSELNVAYGLADSRVQSCFNSNGQLTVVNGVNPCVANVENNSTGPNGISIVSVQPTDQQGNPVSLLNRGHTGYVKVVIDSSASTKSLVTVNIFDSNVSSLGTVSAQYTLNPGQSKVVLPYYVSAQSGTGLASIYANVFTDWPNKGGTSQTNELSYFVGLS